MTGSATLPWLNMGSGCDITAVSLSAADVQTAMNAATAGQTVCLPAGTAHWSTQVSWSVPSNVRLKGAGTTAVGGGDQTVIIDDYGTNAPLLNLVTAGGNFRMTGITVQGGTGVLKDGGLINVDGSAAVRIDHCHINTQTYSPSNNLKCLRIGSGIFGVMDNCILDLYSTSAIYIYNGQGADGQGNATWAADTLPGGSNYFFMEDNVVNGTPSTFDTRLVDAFSAARHVIRFNTFTASCIGEVHATGHAGDDRGCRAQEVYGNTCTLGAGQSQPNFDMVDIGSGTAFVWGNVVNTGALKNIFHFNVTRKDNATYTQSATPNGWGYAGTDFNGTGSNWDQNNSAGTGYACLDQPGRGKGDLLTGTFPNKVNNTTSTIAWPNQALEPIYVWNNNAAPASGWGGSFYSNDTATASGSRVVSDRDYYAQASGAQSNPTTPFNGTTGCGWGTLANRPTTATVGVGYFATDQGSWNTSGSNPQGVNMAGASGVLYVCTSTNVWSSYYTPYTYPHPLRSW